MDKKIYIIDRNGRMHLIELNDLSINGETITSVEQAENILLKLFTNRNDIILKNTTHFKVFDSKGLIGFQLVPNSD